MSPTGAGPLLGSEVGRQVCSSGWLCWAASQAWPARLTHTPADSSPATARHKHEHEHGRHEYKHALSSKCCSKRTYPRHALSSTCCSKRTNPCSHFKQTNLRAQMSEGPNTTTAAAAAPAPSRQNTNATHHRDSLSSGLLPRLLLLPQRHEPQRLAVSSRLCRSLGRRWRVDSRDMRLPTKQRRTYVLLYRPCSCCWPLLFYCVICCRVRLLLLLLLFELLLGCYQCC